jgi:hypothetical protein
LTDLTLSTSAWVTGLHSAPWLYPILVLPSAPPALKNEGRLKIVTTHDPPASPSWVSLITRVEGNEGRTESEVVSESVGLLALGLHDSRDTSRVLHVSSPSPELADEVEGHSETSRSEGVSLGLESSRRVDDVLASVGEVLGVDEVVGASGGGESKSVDGKELVGGD